MPLSRTHGRISSDETLIASAAIQRHELLAQALTFLYKVANEPIISERHEYCGRCACDVRIIDQGLNYKSFE